MPQLVTIYGGSGFVGRYIARRMAKEGWRVRVAVRKPNEALFVKPYGSVGQVEPVFCNIRDDASVETVMTEADAVVNCVGVLSPSGKNTFEAVHVEGAERIARIAAAKGIARFVHVSSLGAGDASDYGRSKARGDALVQHHMPGAMILRPSVIFGTEDEFFNRFAAMARLSPVLPIAMGDTLMQPVYVDDVAKAAVMGVLGQADGGVYELGGAEVKSFRTLMEQMLEVIRRKRGLVEMPLPLARIMAGTLDTLQSLSFGLYHNGTLTRDQLASLSVDNVVSEGSKGLQALGIEPTRLDTILPDYLWPFRDAGQYNDLQKSAQNLKG